MVNVTRDIMIDTIIMDLVNTIIESHKDIGYNILRELGNFDAIDDETLLNMYDQTISAS